jgi:hypothetical protein
MSRPFMGEALAGHARFEAERRRKSFPKKIRAGADAEALTLNYQAWCAIADWLETGRCTYLNSWGGVADPPRTVIGWPLLEAAAAKELERVEHKMREARDDEASDREDLLRRRDALFAIHLVVSRRRADLEELNRLAREQSAERIREAA